MTTAASVPMISLQAVNKHFGDLHVLQNINLDVPRGQVVVVLGPSGSGKSTLCRTINRLEPIDSGTISIDGEVLRTDGTAVPGLYAAGACASNIARDGKGYASGVQLGEGSFFGRRAGAHAAAR